MVKFEDIFIRERLIAREQGREEGIEEGIKQGKEQYKEEVEEELVEGVRNTFIKEMYNVYIAYTENPNVWDFLNKYKNLNFTNEEIELINSWDFKVC